MFLYCVCGCFCNRVIRKKRGWLVIPNYVFWKELPFYVWDGFTFLCCCICCITRCAKLREQSTESSELLEQREQDEFSVHFNAQPQRYGFAGN